MANYRPISTEIWRDQTFKRLDTTEKMFWVFLLTNHLTTQCGIYYVSPSEIGHYCGISTEQVHLLLERFEHRYQLIQYNWEHEEVGINNWYKYHTNDSATVIACIKKELESVRSYELVKVVQENCQVSKIKKELLNRQKQMKLRSTAKGVNGGCLEGESPQVDENQQVLKGYGEKEKEKEKEKKGGKRKRAAAEDFFSKNENLTTSTDRKTNSPQDAEKEKSCAKKEKDETAIIDEMQAIWQSRFSDYVWQERDSRSALELHAALQQRYGPARDGLASWKYVVEHLPGWIIEKFYAEVPTILAKINSICDEIKYNTTGRPVGGPNRAPQRATGGPIGKSHQTGVGKYLPHLAKSRVC